MVLCALGLIQPLGYCLRSEFNQEQWTAVSAALALGLFAYGILTEEWAIAGFGQIFLGMSISYILLPGLGLADPSRFLYVAAPFIVIAGVVNGLELLCRARRLHETAIYDLLNGAMWFYIVGGLILLAIVIPIHVQQRWQLVTYAASALALQAISIAVARDSRPWLSLPLVFVGFLIWLVPRGYGDELTFYGDTTSFLAVACVLSMEILARIADPKYAESRSWHIATIFQGMGILLIATNSAAAREFGPHYITLSWVGIAVFNFCLGLALKEPIYRLSGLAILLFSLARLFVYDIWQFATVFKIATIVAPGIVCIAVSYAYVLRAKRIKQKIKTNL
jgi:hypothetical protein